MERFKSTNSNKAFATVEPGTVLVQKSGQIRISGDLIPEALRRKPLNFIAFPDPERMTVRLKIMARDSGNGMHDGIGQLVHAFYQSPRAISPQVPFSRVLKMLGLGHPQRSLSFPAKLVGGDIEVHIDYKRPPARKKERGR